MRIPPVLLCGIAALLVTAANGQVLQGLQRPVGAVGDAVGGVTGPILGPVLDRTEALVGNVSQLASARLSRLGDLVRSNRQALEFDDRGDPAVRGEVIGVDISPAAIEAARNAGFTVTSTESIEGLGIGTVTLATPQGMTLARALKKIRSIAPGDWSANQLHFESGTAAMQVTGVAANRGSASHARIGIIDGGVAEHSTLTGAIEQRGFARGAPVASAHGTAIASLIVGQGAIKGVLPGSPLLVADVYGRDPAGGNALAIARALGWMSARGIPVVSVSLVGPANPLLAKVIAAARAKGVSIVAAVGNDGPAAPPAYPASYSGVIAVTGVDGRDRALIEAGRAMHLDYAAPGADMLGAKTGGGTMRLRGTSYAAPLVAARLAAGASLEREAIDLGKPGPDKIYGRGLVCGDCRTRP
jgi:minor extracellular protease Epr